MYELLYPHFLFLLILPIILLMFPPLKLRHASLFFPVAHSWVAPGHNLGLRKNHVFSIAKWIFLYVGWLAWCLTLCGPVYIPPAEKEIKEQRNILLATDISLSMNTRDWQDSKNGNRLSRWDAVKLMISDFINARPGDCFAHVVFGQEAYLQVPFTQDPQVITKLQEKVRLGDAGPTTSIGNAIAVSLKHFHSDSITRKVMVLVTDGLDTQNGISPLQMAKEAAKDSVRIYTIAMGSPSEGFKNVDHEQLSEISSLTNGKTFLASSMTDLKNILLDINTIEPTEYVLLKDIPGRELYYYPLTLALGIFTISFISNNIKDFR